MSGRGLYGERRDLDRAADSLAALRAPGVDAWVATSSAAGEPYLVPLTPAWLPGDRVLLASARRTRTMRNLEATGAARLAYGATRDVVLVDAVLERVVDVADDADLGELYAAQADWDPRGIQGQAFAVLRAQRILAWRDEAEIAGRVLMRDGVWVALS
ncbi:hypothetical protein Xcel_1763 [Xylanimonas cellulosilytica DSM 15894]|uniref:Pyridoxamine 5'-phosphate oxidase N-terminal domain-containing protein n=1 Tax=Xylanimonas cellulosilytica (strain DSM 15894 / JCM 12276 / CECT 5975 / KCTC 9989 / LMG 20990 / NBRC 107835 / XIL07) TaxID=446471 RepID=D1BSU1_XYLCX|nr:pyridoxamine 5'-phosphate oxidase family protein [Xylanimonas cellulosilytica]ACZ30783.1 hypothetical protein Xcel_1763 [Xylanimonas cellulosilytica DSM 15894]